MVDIEKLTGAEHQRTAAAMLAIAVLGEIIFWHCSSSRQSPQSPPAVSLQQQSAFIINIHRMFATMDRTAVAYVTPFTACLRSNSKAGHTLAAQSVLAAEMLAVMAAQRLETQLDLAAGMAAWHSDLRA